MRTFYDNWKSMDYNSSVATDEISPVATGEIEGSEKESITIIDIEKSTIKFEKNS